MVFAYRKRGRVTFVLHTSFVLHRSLVLCVDCEAKSIPTLTGGGGGHLRGVPLVVS